MITWLLFMLLMETSLHKVLKYEIVHTVLVHQYFLWKQERFWFEACSLYSTYPPEDTAYWTGNPWSLEADGGIKPAGRNLSCKSP